MHHACTHVWCIRLFACNVAQTVHLHRAPIMHQEVRDFAGEVWASFTIRELHYRRMYVSILSLGLGEKAVSIKHGSAHVCSREVQNLQHDLTAWHNITVLYIVILSGNVLSCAPVSTSFQQLANRFSMKCTWRNDMHLVQCLLYCLSLNLSHRTAGHPFASKSLQTFVCQQHTFTKQT